MGNLIQSNLASLSLPFGTMVSATLTNQPTKLMFTVNVPFTIKPGDYPITITGKDVTGISQTGTLTITVLKEKPIINSLTKGHLFIAGSSFGTMPMVKINGKDLGERIAGVTDVTITLKGTKKRLGIVKGRNELAITVDGETVTSTFHLK
ncbi:MAG: hypothetical protein AB1489_14370 [Acidobacteriota bacterium]